MAPTVQAQEADRDGADPVAEGPPSVVGDSARDLAFTPLTRCRVLDTRVEGGRLTVGVPRHFDVAGPLAGQGGAADCLIPVGATVVMIKLTAVRPDGIGDLVVWAFGATPDVGHILRFRPGSRGLQVAPPEMLLPVRNPAVGSCTHDLSVQASRAETDLVADVTGYFAAISVPWSALAGKPAGFADDTDNDALAGLACGGTQVPKRTGGVWSCAADNDTTYSVLVNGGLGQNNTQFFVLNSGITNAMLASDSVNAPKIADNAVGAFEIADNAVGTAEIVDGAVGAPDIATNAVTASEIAADAVGTSEIADSSVTAADIATGAVGTAEIQDGSVSAADIGAAAVGRSEIANEVPLYGVNLPYCSYRELTLDSTCSTLLCNPALNRYFTCDGDCSALSSRSCPNVVVGYVIGP
jgi:hypothetical protein